MSPRPALAVIHQLEVAHIRHKVGLPNIAGKLKAFIVSCMEEPLAVKVTISAIEPVLELEVIVEDEVAKLPDRTAFAGSVATSDRLVRTMVKIADVPLVEAVKMMTLTPARILGLDRTRGCIAPGMDADIVLFDEDINIKKTIIGGKCYFTIQ